MIDLQDRQHVPSLEKLCAYIRLPAFRTLCETLSK